MRKRHLIILIGALTISALVLWDRTDQFNTLREHERHLETTSMPEPIDTIDIDSLSSVALDRYDEMVVRTRRNDAVKLAPVKKSPTADSVIVNIRTKDSVVVNIRTKDSVVVNLDTVKRDTVIYETRMIRTPIIVVDTVTGGPTPVAKPRKRQRMRRSGDELRIE